SIEHSDLTKVVAGTKLKVSVTLKEGYELSELKAGEQDILASREFVVQGNTEVRATYRRKAPTTYRVDLKQSEGGTLSIEHSDLTKVVAGTKLKVSVTLKEGYELIELKAGQQDILSSREFVVQGNTEVRAIYRRVVVPVAPPVVPHEDDKPRLDAEVKVYPTVFTTELHISGYESLSHIELYNLGGHRLRRYAPQATLSVEGLPAGIYLVLLHSSKAGVRPQRLTVQKR
ncbi:MAG: T9SS type A sorting domain-containing protein, partial [Porphyromonas sp.]|nr:T9SS type A sorting domain-containing protein [Porphyromonas sp.]